MGGDRIANSAAIDDSVGLAAYGIDDWPYAMVPHQGGIGLITGEFINCRLTTVDKGIYRIPYRAIVPKEADCTNLLVPVCLSASHVASLSLRMEPVYVILGQAAVSAAGAHDHCGTGGFSFRGLEDGERGDVFIRIAERSGCAIFPEGKGGKRFRSRNRHDRD